MAIDHFHPSLPRQLGFACALAPAGGFVDRSGDRRIGQLQTNPRLLERECHLDELIEDLDPLVAPGSKGGVGYNAPGRAFGPHLQSVTRRMSVA